MGWFKKKEKKQEKEIPSLPELPKLPELPQSKIKNLEPLHQLPSFPVDSLGEKFSQNTIKEAISGKKEVEGSHEMEDLEEHEESQMFQRPSKKMAREISFENRIPKDFEKAARKVKEAEPIFIRIDKFEEGLHVFERIKKQISEIEKMLKDIKDIKEEEEKELEMWENEIRIAKEEIEKVDKNLFSKIE